MEALLTPKETENEIAPPGNYWVFTLTGALALGKTAGAVICDNPYTAPTGWVNAGYVTPEELE